MRTFATSKRTHSLLFWHCSFGVPGIFNDDNVLQRSPIFDEALSGAAPRIHHINGKEHKGGYRLSDGIYPKCLVGISNPVMQDRKLFAKCQGAYRKDIEIFGFLQHRLPIVNTRHERNQR